MTHSAESASIPAPTGVPFTRAAIATIAAGLVAALITWSAGEALMIDETGQGSKGGRERISPAVYSTRNAMVGLGTLGGSLGLELGLAGGLLRRSARSAGLAGFAGAALGGAAGAGAASALVPLYFRHYAGADMVLPLLVHGGLWAAISVAAGLAFGLGAGGPGRARTAAAHAIVAALVATLIYEFAGVGLFPAAQTDRPLPMSPGSRAFAYLVVSVTVGMAMAIEAARHRSPSVAPPATDS